MDFTKQEKIDMMSRWLEKNRPESLLAFEVFLDTDSVRAQAMLGWVLMGFDAGSQAEVLGNECEIVWGDEVVDNKIFMIKCCRTVFGYGLKEAKDFVEQVTVEVSGNKAKELQQLINHEQRFGDSIKLKIRDKTALVRDGKLDFFFANTEDNLPKIRHIRSALSIPLKEAKDFVDQGVVHDLRKDECYRLEVLFTTSGFSYEVRDFNE